MTSFTALPILISDPSRPCIVLFVLRCTGARSQVGIEVDTPQILGNRLFSKAEVCYRPLLEPIDSLSIQSERL